MYKISLKAARVNADLSQDEAANRLHISKNTLVNWEKGRTFPDYSELTRLCSIYNNIPVDIIFLPIQST